MVTDVTTGEPVAANVIGAVEGKDDTDGDEELITTQAQVREGPGHNLHRKVKRPRHRARPQVINEVPDLALHRRGKKGGQVPLHMQGGFPFIFEQSHAGGWVDDSDSDCSDVFSEVRNARIDTMKQIYMILGVVVVVIFSVSSIYLYEWIYGKPKVSLSFKSDQLTCNQSPLSLSIARFPKIHLTSWTTTKTTNCKEHRTHELC